MRRAVETARRALCLKKKCGAVIVRDGRVIGEGYNAPPLDREEHRICREAFDPGKPKYDRTCCLHAEWRAIMDALRRNPDQLPGSTIYFTRVDENGEIVKSGEPFCTVCSRVALDAGIATFVLWQEPGLRAYPADVYNRLSYEYVHPVAS